MKKIYCFAIFLFAMITAFAQKESFDMVTYKPIEGWKKERTDKVVSFSSTDEVKGTFCAISIYPSTEGTADSKTNFDNSWKKIVQEPLGASNAAMEASSTQNEWELQTGSAQFNKGGLAGVAMLVTASSNGKMINMLVLFNSDTYSTQLNDFIGSIELQKLSATNNNEAPTTASSGNRNNVVTGLWKNNLLETSGYINGTPMYTAGYFRKEYTFNNNGTYVFMQKNWSVYAKSIIFIYETGKYTLAGDKLTTTPQSGKNEEWSKGADGRTGSWGKLIKSTSRKLDIGIYTFTKDQYNTVTLREYSNAEEGKNGSIYRFDPKSEALITLPPGF